MNKIFRRLGVILAILGLGIAGGLPNTGRADALSIDDAEQSLVTVAKIEFKNDKEGEGNLTADENCETNLFGLRPWYAGLAVKNGNRCVVGQPASDEYIPAFVWTIILNVMADLFIVVAYVTIAFIIYGGYLYLLSGGDTGKVAKGKNTITAAAIGLIIVLLAQTIVNIILGVIGA